MFTNIARNAVEAMPVGGSLTVRTSIASAAEAWPGLPVRRAGDAQTGREAVRIEFQDTGPGIAEEIRGHLFEPFNSSKEKGTGLGLFISREIVEGHGDGSRSPRRPATERLSPSIFPSMDPTSPQTSTILLVDDEANALRVLSAILQEAGYACVTAQSVDEAISRIEGGADRRPRHRSPDAGPVGPRPLRARPDPRAEDPRDLPHGLRDGRFGRSGGQGRRLLLLHQASGLHALLRGRPAGGRAPAAHPAHGGRLASGEGSRAGSGHGRTEQRHAGDLPAHPDGGRVPGDGPNPGRERDRQGVDRPGGPLPVPRHRNPFVGINCGALPPTLLESELFGHEKGAFTSAVGRRIGRFELADGGTLFLDEIGEMDVSLQVKLLRVLQEREFERVGSSARIKVDLRLVAASNKDLKAEVEAGRFRADLFYRLNVIPIRIPPLRERLDDLPLLAFHFLERYAGLNKKEVKGIDSPALSRMMSYSWPGNVRELENVIERGSFSAPGLRSRKGTSRPISPRPAGPPPETREVKPLSLLEKETIIDTLRRAYGNKSKAARMLGISRKVLYARLREYGIE